MDNGLIFMSIGMIASFMTGLYFERLKARRFLHEITRSVMSRESIKIEDQASFVATTGTILSAYYNDHFLKNIAQEANDRMSQTKMNKSQTQK